MSGATREVTEGLSALVAAAILLYVGFWMHGKSQARQWQAYLDRRLAGALAGRTLWALAFVSFLAVYREAFETVLFYEALAVQAGPGGGVPLLARARRRGRSPPRARAGSYRPRQRAAALRPLLRRQRRAARRYAPSSSRARASPRSRRRAMRLTRRSPEPCRSAHRAPPGRLVAVIVCGFADDAYQRRGRFVNASDESGPICFVIALDRMLNARDVGAGRRRCLSWNLRIGSSRSTACTLTHHVACGGGSG